MTGARILVLTPTLGGRDGLSELSRQFVAALRAAGAVVQVWSLGDRAAPPADRVGGADVHAAGGSRVRYVMRALAGAVQAARPDLVLVMHLSLLPVAWPLVVRGVPFVPVLVGVEAWRRLPRWRAGLLRRASRLLAISRHTADRFRAVNPDVPAPPITVIWPATPPLPAPAPAATPVAGPFAFIVGRMWAEERYKGHDQLIAAWPALTARVPGASLVVAGTGDDEARLRARVRDAGLDGAVRFVGAVSDDTLAALYRDCACFVLPSRDEGFGLVLLEAMAAGRACIAGRGAAEEIVEHDVTGIIVDPDRPAQLVEALAKLLADPSRAARMGEAGRARARERFGAPRLAADLAAALAPMLERAAPPSTC